MMELTEKLRKTNLESQREVQENNEHKMWDFEQLRGYSVLKWWRGAALVNQGDFDLLSHDGID